MASHIGTPRRSQASSKPQLPASGLAAPVIHGALYRLPFGLGHRSIVCPLNPQRGSHPFTAPNWKITHVRH
ncbi:hypothetical protein AVMA1855_21795 [Acidovorax sp. SUPP1855]|uniref:hypothetical protein n=1 Tax=Acidovorax sp. SUPP1855 TaxID=431774 RepID=UPI0023DE3FDE|nr:hypothetical protein [Acidovorax sp. SUPP1855]GKS86833.1 hypothetical protein AVMA1855_21795 [Acidovorax sp. SUPP1855]